MKKSILISFAILATFSLAAFSYTTWKKNVYAQNESKAMPSLIQNSFDPFQFQVMDMTDFVYNIDSRFLATITKHKLQQAKTIADVVPEHATDGMESFRNVMLKVYSDKKEARASGDQSEFNSEQLALIQSIDYSTNFSVESHCMYKSPETGFVRNYSFVYYITVVPEKEAEYTDGEESLVDYLRENSKEATKIINWNLLKPGKVYFTITKNGEVGDVQLDSSSGYSTMDNTMMELIKTLPGKWNPATNAHGENVEQKLVFSYGMMGC